MRSFISRKWRLMRRSSRAADFPCGAWAVEQTKTASWLHRCRYRCRYESETETTPSGKLILNMDGALCRSAAQLSIMFKLCFGFQKWFWFHTYLLNANVAFVSGFAAACFKCFVGSVLSIGLALSPSSYHLPKIAFPRWLVSDFGVASFSSLAVGNHLNFWSLNSFWFIYFVCFCFCFSSLFGFCVCVLFCRRQKALHFVVALCLARFLFRFRYVLSESLHWIFPELCA